MAAEEWAKQLKKREVRKAQPGSWEKTRKNWDPANKIVFSNDIAGTKFFHKPIGHRAIGVVYRPDELQFPYFVPSILPKRYDAFIFIDNTTALHPIDIKLSNEPPDLYPSGS